MDNQTKTELEAAAFRRLLDHLRHRTDVQNIDLMGWGGFCRNCLADWYKDAAAARGMDLSKPRRARSSTACPMRNGGTNTRPKPAPSRWPAWTPA